MSNDDERQATDGARRGRAKANRESKRARTEVELLTEISAKLDRVVAVLAAQGKDRATQIDVLSSAGCDSAFIGTLLGITAGAVRKHQSRRKHERDGSHDEDGPTPPPV